MNRTITMNLSGIIFHIEEDAYDRLNKYLSTIRSYFSHSDGKDEIMSDIEARIAEMLSEKVNKTKQAVLMSDVENVISLMGKPEDFAGDAETSEKRTEEKTYYTEDGKNRRRRVFRDPDEKILGGVCSGIANYFDFDPIWLRGAFAVSFFVFGTGLLLYIILWMIIPQAKTTAEKLEMHGEKVDVSNIGKKVNEEFDDFKKRMESYGDEFKKKETKEKIKTSSQKAVEFTGDVLGNMVKIIARIGAVFLIILAVIIMVVLLGSIFGSTNIIQINDGGLRSGFNVPDLINNFFPAGMSPELIYAGLLLFIGVPVISIIYSGIKFLLGIKTKNKIVKYTFNILWLCGLAIMIYVGIQTGNDFTEDAMVKQRMEIKQADTLYLSVKNLDKYYDEDNLHSKYSGRSHYQVGNLKWDYVEKSGKDDIFNCPIEMDIVASETDSFQLIQVRTSCGADKKEASYRAKNIKYSMSQNDSLLEFEPSFQIEPNDKWRSQEVKLILKVPVGKVIYLKKGMEYIIYDVDNVTNTWDSEMVGRRWIMKPEGLTCIDCNGLDNMTELEKQEEFQKHMEAPIPPPAPPSKKN